MRSAYSKEYFFLSITNILKKQDITNYISRKRKENSNQLSKDLKKLVGVLDNRLMDGYEFKLTEEHTEQGLSWLKQHLFKKNGSYKNNKISRCFGEREKDIIKDFSHFTFIDLYYYGSRVNPAYRVYDRKGNYFEYTVDAFSLPEVIG